MLKFGSVRFNQSWSSTPGLPTNGGLVLKYVLSESIHNRSSGTHFDKFLISNFLKGLTYSGILFSCHILIQFHTSYYPFYFLVIPTFTPFDTPLFSINSSSGASDLSYLDFDRFVL